MAARSARARTSVRSLFGGFAAWQLWGQGIGAQALLSVEGYSALCRMNAIKRLCIGDKTLSFNCAR